MEYRPMNGMTTYNYTWSLSILDRHTSFKMHFFEEKKTAEAKLTDMHIAQFSFIQKRPPQKKNDRFTLYE